MDRVGAACARRVDDLARVEMGRDRRLAEYLDRLVRHSHMSRPAPRPDDGSRREAMPSSRKVRMMRQAISPRLATSTLRTE